ncbi:JAB domain-containing protein [Croceicoccus sediminis]|uniref:JAB domain-containing protein n=1 Tax=Croceicoccus sediminis TaxID=2571150 RepID=UPI0014781C71|nr:JAB domain-containing protein [Croceicoccus sediminis]
MGNIPSAPELFRSICKSSSAADRGLGLRRDEIGAEWDHYPDARLRDNLCHQPKANCKKEILAGRTRSVFDPDGEISASFTQCLVDLMGQAHNEQLRAVMLDKRAGYLADFLVAVGPLALVRSSYRSVIEPALKSGAQRMVLVHNHPSGDPRPSAEDLRTTKSLVALTNALDLILDDHLIVGRRAVFSIRHGKVVFS